MKLNVKKKIVPNYGNPILNVAYEKYNNGENVTYEEFVIMLSTNDELWFGYDGCEFFIEHTGPNIVSMCITRLDGPRDVMERCEQFASIIDLLDNFRINDKRIRDVWESVFSTVCIKP
jgi:hypothetical protein